MKIIHLKQILQYREEDLSSKDKRIKELTLKFDTFRKDQSEEIKKVTSEYELKINNLKDKQAK